MSVLESLPPHPISVDAVDGLDEHPRVTGTIVDQILRRVDDVLVLTFGLALDDYSVVAIGYDPAQSGYVRIEHVTDAGDREAATELAQAANYAWLRDRFGDYDTYEHRVFLTDWTRDGEDS